MRLTAAVIPVVALFFGCAVRSQPPAPRDSDYMQVPEKSEQKIFSAKRQELHGAIDRANRKLQEFDQEKAGPQSAPP